MRLLTKIFEFISKRNVIQVTDRLKISNSAKISGCKLFGNIEISENVKIAGGVQIHSESKKVTIGRYSAINGPNTDIHCYINSVRIGAFTSIARNVNIQEFNHNYTGISTYLINKNIFGKSKSLDIHSKGEIIIGNDVWIGAQCVILSGAKIGNGAIIAANSVVVGDIPAYAIAAGTPAKVLKFRFDRETIDILESMAWWEWSIEKIIENEDLFNLKKLILVV